MLQAFVYHRVLTWETLLSISVFCVDFSVQHSGKNGLLGDSL